MSTSWLQQAFKRDDIQQLFWLMLMALLGAAAYQLTLPLFGNIELVCGNLFPLLLVYRCRPSLVALSALLAALSLWLRWDNPYILLTFSLEAYVVSLMVRRGINMLFADLVYWLCIGVPIVTLIVLLINPIPPEYIVHVLIKQVLNGTAYTLVALALLHWRVVGRYLMPKRNETRTFRRQVSQNLLGIMMVVVLFAGLLIEQVQVREKANQLQREMNSLLYGLAERVDGHIKQSQLHIIALREYLSQRETDDSDKRLLLESLHLANPAFQTMLISDVEGKIVAASPSSLILDGHMEASAFDISDRSYFIEAKKSFKPYVSDAFQGRGFGNDVIVAVSAAYQQQGEFAGIVEGSLNLFDLINEQQEGQPQEFLWMIVNSDNQLLFAAKSLQLKPFQTIAIEKLPLSANVFSLPSIKLESGDLTPQYLLSDTVLNNGWRVMVMRNYREVISENQQRYMLFLAMVGAGGVITWLFSGWFARRSTRPIELLAEHALSRSEGGQLDTSAYRYSPVELQKLARVLADKSQQIEAHNRHLDQQINERTMQLSEANALLTESQMLLHKVIDAIPARVFWKNAQLQYSGCNALFAQDAGLTNKADIVGKTDHDLSWRSRADMFENDDIEVIVSGEAKLHELVQQARSDCSECWFEISKIPLSNSKGEVIGILGTYQDVTERIEREQALKEATVAAEAATEAKSSFLANMSHEIRTPMNAIVGMVELMLDGELSAQQGKYLHRIQTSTEHLLQIINDILDYSKIEAGKLSLTAEPFLFSDVVNEVVELFEQAMKQKGLCFEAQVADDLPAMMGDSLRLRQVLMNLVGNALKFTREGRVTLTVTKISQSAQQLSLQVVVEDSGIGMTEPQLNRLFTPFTQADSTTTRRFGGSGLGLMISQQLVNMMGGRIEVSSKPDLGSCFSFIITLPVTSQAVERRGGWSVSSDFKKLNCRVLLVDDNEINLEVAAGMLSRLGAQVTLANNGSEAVTKVLQQPFDLVFMDVQMPVMDGYQAAAAILAQVNNPPPIVALTANAQREEETRAMAAGMSGYLSKPVRQAELYKKITSLLGARSFTTDAAIVTPDPIESDAIAVNKSPMDPEVKSGLQQCGGDQALYCRLVAQLAELWRGMDEMLLQWPSSQDQSQAIAELQTNLHRLKGVTGNLGATRAAEQLAVIEQALKTTARIETSLEAQQFVNSHADDLEKLRHYMADYLASAMALKAPQSVEDKTERVGETEALQALKEYLIKLVSSLKENEYLESAPLQHTLQQPLDDRLKEQLTSLLNALDNFDNDCALTLAEKVLAQLD